MNKHGKKLKNNKPLPEFDKSKVAKDYKEERVFGKDVKNINKSTKQSENIVKFTKNAVIAIKDNADQSSKAFPENSFSENTNESFNVGRALNKPNTLPDYITMKRVKTEVTVVDNKIANAKNAGDKAKKNDVLVNANKQGKLNKTNSLNSLVGKQNAELNESNNDILNESIVSMTNTMKGFFRGSNVAHFGSYENPTKYDSKMNTINNKSSSNQNQVKSKLPLSSNINNSLSKSDSGLSEMDRLFKNDIFYVAEYVVDIIKEVFDTQVSFYMFI